MNVHVFDPSNFFLLQVCTNYILVNFEQVGHIHVFERNTLHMTHPTQVKITEGYRALSLQLRQEIEEIMRTHNLLHNGS